MKPAIKPLGRVPALDGVRGFAIALVLGYHVLWLPGGLFGVDLFFALSGFLITTLLLEERERTGSVDLRAFYLRRAHRLLPAVLALLLVVSTFFVVSHDWARLGFAVAVLFYIGNLVEIVVHAFPRAGLSQMWSLGQEEQFYVIWPALLFWLLHSRKVWSIGRGLLVGAVAVAAWRTACWFAFGGAAHTFLSPDTRSDALLLGCALAAARAAGHWPGRLIRLSAPLALAGLVAAAWWTKTNGEVIAVFPVVAVCCVLLVGASLEGGPVARLLAVAPLRWLGLISYSIYVWHVAVFDVVSGSQVLKLGIAVILGAASYRWIEKPFRLRRKAVVERPAHPVRPVEIEAPAT